MHIEHPGVLLAGFGVGRVHDPVLHLHSIGARNPAFFGKNDLLLLYPGVEFRELARLAVAITQIELVGVGNADQRIDDPSTAFTKCADSGWCLDNRRYGTTLERRA